MPSPSLPTTHRLHGFIRIIQIFAALSFCTRLGLIVFAWPDLNHGLPLVLGILAGLIYDVGTAIMIATPFVFWMWLTPGRFWKAKWHRLLARAVVFAFVCLLVFVALSEFLFWAEFGCRFNFIAVDYLIYTTEVVRNIHESYNLPLVLGGTLLTASALYALAWKAGWLSGWVESDTPHRERWKPALAILATAGLLGFFLRQDQLPDFHNNYNREIACNGPFAFFAAYQSNELDYDQFYLRREPAEVSKRLTSLVTLPGQVVSNSPDAVTRAVKGSDKPLKLNVIQLTIESLSGEFMAEWGNTQKLTPFLDDLSRNSVFFRQLYATGTRTVRGMEALTLSYPPTPGQSIVRRPHNENLFTLGSVLSSQGYECSFLYGGNGFFDNMNAYFEANGYRIHDRRSMAPGDVVTMENAWGACDGDVFNWSLAEADRSAASGKPFHQFIMTTSNHRPYTFPENKVAFPQGSRDGAVAYTDYAIASFLKAAASKPWFKDTLFVIIADHCHGSARKAELEVRKYEIPLFLYCPAHLPARRVETLCSQMDTAPTVMGVLGLPYDSRFLGGDILAEGFRPRAFISNYQKIGYLTEDKLVVLKPVRKFSLYRCDRSTGALTALEGEKDEQLEDAIAYYQGASTLFKSRLYSSLPGLKDKPTKNP